MKHLGRDPDAAIRNRRRLTMAYWRLSIAEARRNSEMRQHDMNAIPLEPERPNSPNVKILRVDGSHNKKIPPAGV